MIELEILQKAVELSQNGNQKEAEIMFSKLLDENPNDGILYSAAGLFYIGIKDFDKAVELLKKACDLNESLGNVSALGFAHYEKRDFAEAVQTLEHALELGENVDIYNKLILSLFEIKQYKRAIELTEKMCELYPDNPKTISNKVKSLTRQGKLLEAEKECVEYLKKNPDDSIIWYHLGLLKELIYSNDRQAIECYKLAGERGNLNSDYNIGVAYQKLGEYDKAEEYYKKFLAKFPNDNTGVTSLGMCYLSQKKFKEGYELFCKREGGKAEMYTNNLWLPDNKLQKDIIVLCDQGFGDHIQFIRYIPFLSQNHNIQVACGKSLISLFKENYPSIDFINYEEINPDIQAIRITDLAYALNMDFNNIPYSEGYIKVDAAQIENNKTKVGLCWEAGSAGVRGMINRTINVCLFEPLFNLKNIQVYSFQVADTLKGNEKYSDNMINLAKDFKTFYDTARALKAMDVVVTVDTCVAHLAGALGVKTYLLLPYAPDWRWFGGNDSTTPWYKSVEIFKQKNPISWETEINDIINKII